MIQGIDRLFTLVNNSPNPLISNLSDRELTRPEGTGFDLRVKAVYKFNEQSSGFLYNDSWKYRRTPDTNTVCEYSDKKADEQQELVILTKDNYYLVETIEKLQVPENLLGIIHPRTTLFRCGVFMAYSFVSPGYGLEKEGATLTFGLINHSNSPFILQMGARIAHIVFAKIEGKANPYGGQWDDNQGRISTDIEEQI